MLKRLLLAFSVSLCAGPGYAQYIDSSFATYGIAHTNFGGADETAAKVLVQPDGKVLAAGTTNNNGGFSAFVLARYDTAGVLDNTFGTAGKVVTPNNGINDVLGDMALLSNGKILAVGTARTGSFSPWSTKLVKYNANGSIDNTFGTAGVVITQVTQKCDAYNVAVQADGKILICGTEYDDNFYILIRYNADGTIDNSFGTAGIVTGDQFGTGMAIAIQPDGKIIVAGEFWGVGPHAGMVRHDVNGTVDATFGQAGTVIIPSPYFDDLWGGHDIKVLTNGKILVPLFLGSNGIAQEQAIVCYSPLGVIDPTFGTNGYARVSYSGFYEKGEEMALQPDGKILLAGFVKANNSSTRDSLVVTRFTAAGMADQTFGTAGRLAAKLDTGGSRMSSIALQTNGKFLLAGSDGNSTAKKFSVSRFKYVPDGNLSAGETNKAGTNTLLLYPNPVTDVLNIRLNKDECVQATITDITGKIIMEQPVSPASNSINIKALAKGNYILSINRNGVRLSNMFEKL